MNESDEDVVVETDTWSFDNPAVHREYLRPSGDDVVPDMIRHPGYPFMVSMRDDGNDLRPQLIETARLYLGRIPPLVASGLSDPAVTSQGVPDFGWLALTWGDPALLGGGDPRGSFWVRRSVRERSDRTAVLLAGNRLDNGAEIFGLGGSVGLRVVMHVGPPDTDTGRSRVRVTGLSTAALEQALKPAVDRIEIEFDALLRRAVVAAKTAFGFDTPPSLTGLRFGRELSQSIRLFGNGEQGEEGARRVFAWTARLDTPAVMPATREHLIEQVTHLNGPTKVMLADPASQGSGALISARRPTRPEATLDLYRDTTALLPPAVNGRLSLANAFVKVVSPRVGSEPQPPKSDPHSVPDANPMPRSDDLAAIHAYLRGQEWLQRFECYGLLQTDYFKMAKLPLLMMHRASFAYASNGETVNAQVSPDSKGQSLFDPFDADARPQLQVAFGSANLSHREMLPNNAGFMRAQPLGLAADRRWAWHEFGHVLNFASTGELEFRFAHSAGDAMAAIVADPHTELTSPPLLRHLTFPWAMLTRSHARPADLGWCWCGRRSLLRRAELDAAPRIPGGYFEEQLMSSSLFRLYCAIGGETCRDEDRRYGASDYVVYLIMRAIALLGPADKVPARSADQFVSALIDADVGTLDWDVLATWPEEPHNKVSRKLHRVGGAVHKVIRWAFERQGLYATDDSRTIVEGPGAPPKVDIHIPGSDERGDGCYEPVELVWSAAVHQPWHAPVDSIYANGSNTLRVKVRNRGSEEAQDVSVQVLASRADANPLDWKPLAASGQTVTQNLGAGSSRTFAFNAEDAAQQPLTGDYLVLAAATCDADRANLDPKATMPCGDPKWLTDTSLLTDLVANDNNLGLRIINFA